jgi:hypothetical protein
MAKVMESAPAITTETTTLESAMPEMLDEMLARFQEVGVSRILRLADEMVRARLELSPASHLTRPGQTN